MKIIAMMAFALIFPLSAKAEVFKCRINESQTIYQSTPCANAIDARKVEIKQRSAEKEVEAKAKLKEWQANHDAEESARYEATKEHHDRLLRAAEVEATQRNADAQNGQKEALRSTKQTSGSSGRS